MRIDLRTGCEPLSEFCKRLLSIFGWALCPDFREDRDIDVVVEFEPGRVPGFRFIALADALTQLLGRRVDLNTCQSPPIRPVQVGVPRRLRI